MFDRGGLRSAIVTLYNRHMVEGARCGIVTILGWRLRHLQ